VTVQYSVVLSTMQLSVPQYMSVLLSSPLCYAVSVRLLVSLDTRDVLTRILNETEKKIKKRSASLSRFIVYGP